MKRIALLGMPNTGKSTLFNRLTGATSRVGNWPGITVELLSGKILLGNEMVEIIDLPGIYDMHGFSEDEQVVRHFLHDNVPDLALIVLNATQIERQLSLLLQLKQFNLNMIVLLNMADEARKLGITIDTEKMSAALGMPIFLLSAKYGNGYPETLLATTKALRYSTPGMPETVRSQLEQDEYIEREMALILKQTVQIPARLPDNLTSRLDQLMLHPWLGLPIFFGIMYLLFQAIFLFGQPLQGGVNELFGWLREIAIAPALGSLPDLLQGLLLDGVYNGIATVASFLPLIVFFFLFMAIVEDTGYLSRAAFLMDALMAKMGLDGRSFVMLLMGFGCNVPALMGTRVMRSRPLRLLSMLVIPFSLCSARLQVFVFISAALFSPKAAPLVLFSLYLFSFASAILTALLFKRYYPNSEPFVLELPPYRFPTLRQMLMRGWHEVYQFVHRASKFIVAGVVLVWLLTNLPPSAAPAGADTWAGILGAWLHPLFAPIGITPDLTIALIFGFVAKEIVIGSLAVIYGMSGQALSGALALQLDWVQAYSFMLFTLIYTPCLTTIATMRKESNSIGFMWFSIAWSLALAWLSSLLFYQSARALGY
ncbi:MAG TPA: ferrous iron transport protein B [Gallionellaceae bacterium]|jgi:ferrous iron transport protein B|nr:MAG: ferrous iron transport protein B [Gallionellales bacterium 24-53-125]OZB08216.1 MAG: ferrous iron transport protein B [Gallionellales bacterium 39-52-133]HQS58146.1 ferrous iron transport protein B [Gallionellaceae bacterium]HQS73701.1 ferrous iron transport protein B [Gallionellaceae bacterium]